MITHPRKLWGRMQSCAPVGNRRCTARFTSLGRRVSNPPRVASLTLPLIAAQPRIAYNYPTVRKQESEQSATGDPMKIFLLRSAILAGILSYAPRAFAACDLPMFAGA